MRRLLSFVTILAILPLSAWAKEGGDGLALVRAFARPTPTAAQLGAVHSGKGLGLAGTIAKGGPTCVTETINCDSTVSGVLQQTDCPLDDGTFVDFWTFDGAAGDEVTIDLRANDFDTFLFLLDPSPAVVATDDDGGSGTNSRIVFTLDVSGEWAIAVNNLLALTGDPGDYTLSLTCSTGAPTAPAAPSNLAATALSSSEIDLFWQDNSSNEEDFEIQLRTGAGGFQTIGSTPANTEGATVSGLSPETAYTFRVRARNAAGSSDWSNEASATTDPGDGQPPAGDCVPDATTLCLDGDRFRVQIEWRDFGGDAGTAQTATLRSDNSGLFWFFNPDHWEMLVKVLDGCSINGRFWVFASATTNVEYTLRVTDTVTGASVQYSNPLGQASLAITDTRAFMSCP